VPDADCAREKSHKGSVFVVKGTNMSASGFAYYYSVAGISDFPSLAEGKAIPYGHTRSEKARENVDSCGTCQASFQPQICRNWASRASASSNCRVVLNPVHGLGHEGTGNGQPVLRRSKNPTAAAGNEAGQGDHL
jgi:hypothetical protein